MAHDSVPRRSFLGRLSASVAAATAAFAAPAAAQGITRTSSQPDVHALDRWMTAIPGRHRVVFDAVSPKGAIEATMFAWNFLRTSGQPYGLADADHAVIIVLRHRAMVMALPQSVWAAHPAIVPAPYENHMTDRVTSESALRPGAAQSAPEMFQLDTLAKRGVHFAICNSALERNAGTAARAAGTDAKALVAAWTALLPANSHVMPSGITAAQRAQALGFAYAHAG